MTALNAKPRAGEHTELERLRCWNHRVSVCKEHVAAIIDGPCVICERDALAAQNRELITMVQIAYVILADIRNQWPDRHTSGGQGTLAAMRDAIAKETGLDPQQVQDLAQGRP